MQKGRRTVAGTGMGRSSETTEGGDAGVDVLSKKKRKPHPCVWQGWGRVRGLGGGFVCGAIIAALPAYEGNDHVGGVETALHAASRVRGKHIFATLNEVLQCDISYARGKLR